MSEKNSKALRLIDLLADLPAPFLEHIAQFSQIRQMRAGETIFCQGEPSPYCFGILSGQVTIQRMPLEKGFAPKTLSVLGPGALFGEQALFKDSPRTAMALASQNGELVAIQGKRFREWMEKDPASGLPLLVDMLGNTISRLRQTSHELSLVYGVGRFLATEKPIQERLQQTVDFLRASLEGVDEIVVYQRNPYWEEFQPLVRVGEGPKPLTLPAENPFVKQVGAILRPIVPETQHGATALIPFLDAASERPLEGFLWVSSKTNSRAFTPNILLLMDAVSVQITEALLRHKREADQEAQSRLRQNRQSFSI